ncbi:MAG: ABC transporter substrate-binding protein [Chloroflexota bacterium]|nr:ABC transporter substrate-binding protein [Chloroflexota bacterium]MDE2968578.1 ABC transporter substrate-binding protein [Chloroflexota bacterium]
MRAVSVSLRPVALVALAMALAFALACGGSDGDTSTTATTTTTTAPQAPQQPAAAAAPEAATGIFSAPAQPSAAAMPIGEAPTTIADPAMQAKITRVVFGMEPESQEHNTPGRLGPPTNTQNNPMYEYLIGMDPESGAWVPELATSWSVEPDGASIRFQLRKGVPFHKGWGEMTGKDVRHTWQDITHPEASHGNSGNLRRDVEDVLIVNDYEVIFKSPSPNAGLLWILTRQEQSILVQSKDHYDEVGVPDLTKPAIAGTGVYQEVERNQGSYVLYERTPYTHWKMTPDFQELMIKWVPEASTRLAGLLTAEIHVTELPDDLKVQAVDSGMALAAGNAAGLRAFMGLRFGARCPCDIDTRTTIPALDASYKFPDAPLWDIRVRQALNVAIDRNAINEAFFGGKGDLMVRNHHHPTRPGWDPSWETRFEGLYGYNPEKARSLLAEADYGPDNPYEINVQLTQALGWPGGPDVAEAVAGFWRDVGIKTNLQTEDPATQRARGRNFEYSNRAWISGTSSHILMGTRVYDIAANPRIGSPEIPERDEIYYEIARTLDADKQSELFKQLGEVSFLGFYDIPLFWLPPEAAFNPEFVSDYVYPGSVTGTWTHMEFIRAAQ